MDFLLSPYLWIGAVIILTVTLWYTNRDDLLIIQAGDLAGFGTTINVSNVTNLRFKLSGTNYSAVDSLNIGVSQNMTVGGFSILENGPTVYTSTVGNGNPRAKIDSFTGDINADTIYHVKFPIAVNNFYLYTNNND